MNSKTIGLIGITAVVLLALASAGTAQDTPSTAQQEERMGEAVRGYLLKHPEIIDEAMQVLRERQAAEAAAKPAQAQTATARSDLGMSLRVRAMIASVR